MPKKTRKEKIISELRRKLDTVQTENVDVVNQPEENNQKERIPKAFSPVTNYQLPVTNYSPVKSSPLSGKPTMNLDTSYVIKDIRKTFILAFFAISFELVAYWLIDLGGSSFLKFLPIKF